jgi:hypothetical protein
MKITRYMDELRNIVMIKFKLRKLEKVLYVVKIAGDQVVHTYNVVTVLYESVT